VTSTTFRLELFGAPRVLQRGAEVRLPIRKSLALLAYLAVEGRTTRAKLAALFWGESGDEAARRNLRRELHRLREAGLAEAIATDDMTVALAPGVASDVAEFVAAESSRPEVALALYRGPLLDGFEVDDAEGFETWLAARREHYAQRWSQSAGAEATRLTAQGDPRAALALHLRLIEADALQEAQFVAAMRLASQLGERSRALELYERCRATLQRELGLEPLPDTTALAEQIRAAERLAPYAEPAVSAGLAELAAPCVGRDDVLDALRSAGARVRLIVGEPGVGKSRVADEYARGAATRLLIAGSELTRNAPLQAVTAALAGALADGRLQQYLQTLDDARRHELARVLPGLDGPQAQAEGAHSSSDSPVARKARLLEAVGAALRALAADGVIVFEDLHWADALTLDLVEDLAHRLARERAEAPVIVITARAQELADHAAAQALMLRLERAQLLQRFDLAPLDAAATTELVQRLSGSSGGTVFAQRLQHATHGNPFFLLETIRFLFASGELAVDERGQWTTRYDEATSDYAELPVPPTIQQAVLERVARLGPAARRVLETAALAGDGFTLDEVQPATALSDWEALDGLERAAGASLIRGAERRYRFGHDLVRVALDGSLGAERRRLIHLRLADTLAARHAEAGRVAWHYDGAGEQKAAVPWHLAAAQAATALYAHTEALEHYRRALVAIDDSAQRVSIHRARFALMKTTFSLRDALEESDALAQIASDRGDQLLADEARIWRAESYMMADDFVHTFETLNTIAAPDPAASLPVTLRHRWRVALASALDGSGRIQESADLLTEELQHAHELEPSQLGELKHHLAYIALGRNDPEAAWEPASEGLRLAQQIGDIELQARCANVVAFVQHTRGHPAEALATLQAVQHVAASNHLTSVQRSLLTNLVKMHVMLNQPEEAHACMQQAIRLFSTDPDKATHSRLQSRLTEVLLLRGDIGGALTSSLESIRLMESVGGPAGTFWPWYQRARLLWQIGASEAAVDVYRQLPHSPAWSEFARPAVDFYSQAFRLPDAAGAVAEELARMPQRGEHSHYDERDLRYWRGYALLLAGNAREAWTLAADLETPPFNLHPAVVEALRLRTALATESNIDLAALIEAARPHFGQSPPLETVEIGRALENALNTVGDRHEADRVARTVDDLVTSLAKTIGDDALRARFLATRH